MSQLERQVKEVRITHRLTESPSCLVVDEHDMGAQMRRIMEAAGQSLPESKPIFELNPEHPLVQKLDLEADEDRFADFVSVLFDPVAIQTKLHFEHFHLSFLVVAGNSLVGSKSASFANSGNLVAKSFTPVIKTLAQLHTAQPVP